VQWLHNDGTHKWTGTLPGLRGAQYYVQAVDRPGNATAVMRRGWLLPVEGCERPGFG
jgi:hypothetical protein